MPDSPPANRKSQIAAILPAFNEELNVSDVLEVLRNTSSLDEIILVDDGSIDGTVNLLKKAALEDRRFKVIVHEKNLGKGQAVFNGWEATCAPILLLLDADLKQLSPEHLNALLAPVIDHRADMTLGLFKGGHRSTDLSHRLTPFLTGQRGLRAEILDYVNWEAARGYGFEVALTIAASQNAFRTRVVPLKGVWHPPSEWRSERGFWGGAAWKLRMYGQIIRAWSVSTRERYPKSKAFFPNTSDF